MCVIILHVGVCFVCRNSCCAMLNTTQVLLDFFIYTEFNPALHLYNDNS